MGWDASALDIDMALKICWFMQRILGKQPVDLLGLARPDPMETPCKPPSTGTPQFGRVIAELIPYPEAGAGLPVYQHQKVPNHPTQAG
jgi:hypothetical protein